MTETVSRALSGRAALVTGAGSGIGRAAALRLAADGARIGALGRTPGQLQEAVAEIRGKRGEAITLVADVTATDQMESAVARLMDEWGRLDIVVACAGVNGVWAPVWQLAPEEWDETLRTNLTGTFLTVRYTVGHMMERGGTVVIVSSVNGTRMFMNAGASAYTASKAGQVAFAKMVALELAQYRIRVNAVCPGWTATEIADNSRFRDVEQVRVYGPIPNRTVPLTGNAPGTPEQVADLILFLSSDSSSHITGTEVWIDGGQSLL